MFGIFSRITAETLSQTGQNLALIGTIAGVAAGVIVIGVAVMLIVRRRNNSDK